MRFRSVFLAMALAVPTTLSAQTPAHNQLVGTWRMLSATLEADGQTRPAYGQSPQGLLVFTPDLHFVEVLTDGDLPRFASDARGQGTDAENRRAMASSIGFFGSYTVDAQGAFSGNRVEAATFPNWVGSVRTVKELSLSVVGDRMTERFRRPEGTEIRIEWQRVTTGEQGDGMPR